MGRLAVAGFALVVGFTTASADQSATVFAGRWQLTTEKAPPEAALALLISEPTPSQRILVERHLKDGVQSESYSMEPNPPPFVHEAKWAGPALILIKRGYASRGAAPSTPDHQEMWSIIADDVLHIAATDALPGAAATTVRLAYRRVRPVLRPGENLLDNSAADRAGAGWLSVGDARIEPCDGNPCFVVRSPGGFTQTILLPTEAAGHFIVMIASGASERIDPSGSITGLPYLHGTVATPDGTRFLTYLQGMAARTKTPNAWVTMAGVFRVPPGGARVYFRLGQAGARGVPQNGSVARFDDLGFYLFPTEAAARAFVASWSGRK